MHISVYELLFLIHYINSKMATVDKKKDRLINKYSYRGKTLDEL